jgi:hypothetical protein
VRRRDQLSITEEHVRTQRQASQRREETSSGRTDVLVILEKCINSITGTDGFRLLCHQFSTYSLLLLAPCILRYKTCSLTTKHVTSALLRLLANGDQGQNTRTTAFPLNTGRWSFIVWWRTTNHFVQLHRSMVSRMKRSVASCFMSRSSVDSKKRNGTQAGLSASEQQALFLVPMKGSDCSLARSAPVMPVGVEAE